MSVSRPDRVDFETPPGFVLLEPDPEMPGVPAPDPEAPPAPELPPLDPPPVCLVFVQAGPRAGRGPLFSESSRDLDPDGFPESFSFYTRPAVAGDEPQAIARATVRALAGRPAPVGLAPIEAVDIDGAPGALLHLAKGGQVGHAQTTLIWHTGREIAVATLLSRPSRLDAREVVVRFAASVSLEK